jgi:hypothetical protein
MFCLSDWLINESSSRVASERSSVTEKLLKKGQIGDQTTASPIEEELIHVRGSSYESY